MYNDKTISFYKNYHLKNIKLTLENTQNYGWML